jgi:hypothetical protein
MNKDINKDMNKDINNIDYQNIGNSLIGHYDNPYYKNTNNLHLDFLQKKIKIYLNEKDILELQLRQINSENKLLEIKIRDLNDKLHLRNIRYSCIANFICTNAFVFRHNLILSTEKYDKNSKDMNLAKDRISFIDFNISRIKIYIDMCN